MSDVSESRALRGAYHMFKFILNIIELCDFLSEPSVQSGI
jgi:hypothetical protein